MRHLVDLVVLDQSMHDALHESLFSYLNLLLEVLNLKLFILVYDFFSARRRLLCILIMTIVFQNRDALDDRFALLMGLSLAPFGAS